ncbi:putative reverse transcriptase domain-containing protein [Tanacetum coccineum]|uniref:Reverse transcriptase domain-containing protein n=1 Tax=Tanacetum coccineum TaxID=301880 RepID=A0ABQ4XDB1_9ASTR
MSSIGGGDFCEYDLDFYDGYEGFVAFVGWCRTICYGYVWDSTSTQEENSVKASHDNLHDVNAGGNGIDVVVPVKSIRAISEQFANTAYGFFGKAGGFSHYGLDEVIENGSWFIRNYPLILKKWNPDDGLNAIATKLGTPLMLDSYTSNMCIQSWGRLSYVRALIEVRADVELKDNIMVAMPKIFREGFYTCIVHVKYEWKPPRCACCKDFGHVSDECPKIVDLDVVKNMKKPNQSTIGVPVGPKVGFKPVKQVYEWKPPSLLEQWKEYYVNGDYDFDPYDDDM